MVIDWPVSSSTFCQSLWNDCRMIFMFDTLKNWGSNFSLWTKTDLIQTPYFLKRCVSAQPILQNVLVFGWGHGSGCCVFSWAWQRTVYVYTLAGAGAAVWARAPFAGGAEVASQAAAGGAEGGADGQTRRSQWWGTSPTFGHTDNLLKKKERWSIWDTTDCTSLLLSPSHNI